MRNPLNTGIGIGVVILMVVSFATKVDFGGRFAPTFGLWVSAWMTLIILSFLYKDNPFYKVAEHIMVGLAMSYFAIYYIFQVLEPRFYDRLVRGNLQAGEQIMGSAELFRWGLLIPAILGCLMLTRIFPKVAWMSRWSIAATIGLGSGLAIPVTIQANITTQIRAAAQLPLDYMTALYGNAEVMPGFTNVPLWQIGVPLLMIGTICGLMYFFFSVPHRGVFGLAASFGIWILMVGFGASFGYTVMARLSLFIGRVFFLLKDWLDWLPPA
jgi:hypothetical protein